MAVSADDLFALLLQMCSFCLFNTASHHKNPLFARFFTSQSALDAIASAAGLVFCPGLLDVLNAATPPSIAWFLSTPNLWELAYSESKKLWAVYCIVLTKAGHRAKLYIGSATAFNQGAYARVKQYQEGNPLPQLVSKAIEEGYEISHHGLLCSMPQPTWLPYRLLMVLLEAVFTYIFRAMRPVFPIMLQLSPWPTAMLDYDGICTHCALTDGILGDFELSDEQLADQAADMADKFKKLKAQNATNYHYKQMATNYDEYMTDANERVARSRENNPELHRETERARNHRIIAAKTHYCPVCDEAFSRQLLLEEHLNCKEHVRIATGNEGSIRCDLCNRGFHNKSNFNRHCKTDTHRDNETARRNA